MTRPILSLLIVIAALGAGCAQTHGAFQPDHPSAVPAPKAEEAQPASRTRREIVQKLLGHNVRVFIYDGNVPRSSSSGVVVGNQVGAGGSTTFIVTQGTALETRGMTAPELRVVVDRPWEDAKAEPMEFLASVVAAPGRGELALIRVEGLTLDPAPLADDEDLVPGDAVLVATAAFGKAVSVAGGLVSQVEWDPKSGKPQLIKTDAAVGFGASGGGVYSAQTGQLLAVVEGYRTAKISLGPDAQQKPQVIDLPIPGETFAMPVSRVRDFLARQGYAHLLENPAREKSLRAASR